MEALSSSSSCDFSQEEMLSVLEALFDHLIERGEENTIFLC